MIRLVAAASVFAFVWTLPAFAVPVSESTVDEACGDQIEGGCSGNTCATGCQKTENGKLYDYGCTFPNKTGKTKATCRKIQVRLAPDAGKNTAIGGTRPLIKAD